jgi:predicted flap endonuclease-1-like 5' DNA nuclease
MMNEKITPIVKSPSRKHHFREGNGFSIPEIEKAEKSVQQLKELGIKIDYFRKSIHERNIEQLKELEPPKKKKEKREPFVKKEKKKAKFIPHTEKKKKEKPKKKEIKPEKKETKEEEIIEEEEKIPKEKVIPLTELYGLGPKTEEKFKSLGVSTVNDLVKENPSELATLVSGSSEESIKDWIEEGKKLLEE